MPRNAAGGEKMKTREPGCLEFLILSMVISIPTILLLSIFVAGLRVGNGLRVNSVDTIRALGAGAFVGAPIGIILCAVIIGWMALSHPKGL